MAESFNFGMDEVLMIQSSQLTEQTNTIKPIPSNQPIPSNGNGMIVKYSELFGN